MSVRRRKSVSDRCKCSEQLLDIYEYIEDIYMGFQHHSLGTFDHLCEMQSEIRDRIKKLKEVKSSE